MAAYVVQVVAVLVVLEVHEELEGLEELEGPELLKLEKPGDHLVWPLFLFYGDSFFYFKTVWYMYSLGSLCLVLRFQMRVQ